jgi:hypothetical protein
MEPEPEHRVPVNIPLVPSTFVVALTLPVAFYGIWWSQLYTWAVAAASSLFI